MKPTEPGAAVVLALAGHPDKVNTCVFSPDGKRAVTAGRDGSVRAWDAATGELRSCFPAGQGQIHHVAFSPDGARLATAGADHTARLWQLDDARLLLTFTGHTSDVLGVAFSPDGALLATASDDKTVRLWDAATGTLTTTIEGNRARPVQVAFSRDGRTVAAAAHDYARIWTLAGKRLAGFKSDAFSSAALSLSPDGRRVACAAAKNTAVVFDIATETPVLKLEGHTDSVEDVAFSPDGTLLLTGSGDGTVRLWDVTTDVTADTTTAATTSAPLATLEAGAGVASVGFSPDGTRMTASAGRAVRLWDVASRAAVATLPGRREAPVAGGAFSPDGRRLVTIHDGNTLRFRDAATGVLLNTFAPHPDVIGSVAFSPDGERLAITSFEGVHVVVAATGALVRSFRDDKCAMSSAVFSPDGKSIAATSSGGKIHVWELGQKSKKARVVKVCKNAWTRTVAFSPDGGRLVSDDTNQHATVFDFKTGAPICTMASVHRANVTYATFTVDGERCATASTDRTARVWDAATGRPLLTLEHPADVSSVVPSPDGRLFVTACADKLARLWDATTGELVRVLEGHDAWVTHATFSPDSRRVLTTSTDDTARLWDAATGRELVALIAFPKGSVAVAPGCLAVTGEVDLGEFTACTGFHRAPLGPHAERYIDHARVAASLA